MTGTLKRRLIGHLSVLKPKSGPGNAFQDRYFAPEVPSCSVRQTIVAALALTISACAAHAARRAKRHRRREGSRRHGERLEVVGFTSTFVPSHLKHFLSGICLIGKMGASTAPHSQSRHLMDHMIYLLWISNPPLVSFSASSFNSSLVVLTSVFFSSAMKAPFRRALL